MLTHGEGIMERKSTIADRHPSTSRSIPSLDGLRAFSVAIVIFAHSLIRLPGRWGRYVLDQLCWIGVSGVDVFFVISGFLITYLLLKELDATGDISLGRFYFRRLLRIFPPFYAYLLVVGVLWAIGVVSLDKASFISAATYTFNYKLFRDSSWFVAHSWSLSLEEQFYLLWPPILLFLGRRRGTFAALGVIVLAPISRLATYWFAPSLRGIEWTMLHTRLDTIMFGCVLALLWDEIRSSRLINRLLHPFVFALAVFYIVLLSPLLTVHLAARFDWTVGYAFRSLLISFVILYAVGKSGSLSGRVLNARVVKHLGVISYSVYLWQQIFMGLPWFPMPLNLLAVLACGELSYWLIEKPSFRLRDHLEQRFAKRVAPFVGAASVLGPNPQHADSR